MYKKLSLSILTMAVALMSSCLSENSTGFLIGGRGGVNTPGSTVSVGGGLLESTWTQIAVPNPKLDLLFIVDGSGSMDGEIEALQSALSSFVGEIVDNEDVDLCVGISYAYPENSPANHLLNSVTQSPVVCSSDFSDTSSMVSAVSDNFQVAIDNLSGTDAEGGLMTLLRAVGSQRGFYISNGFFRDNAAFATVFVADENDYSESNGTAACSGFSVDLTPQGLAGTDCLEALFRYNFYSDQSTGVRIWDSTSITNAVTSFQGTLQTYYALIGIKQSGHGAGGITHGYNEAIDLLNGEYVPLSLAQAAGSSPAAQDTFNQALEPVAQGASQAAQILTVFDLSQKACEDENLEVRVASQVLSDSEYNISIKVANGTELTRITINASSAGEAGDLIKITYKPDEGDC
ncbi:MAG TPA: hypothetical protein PKC21_07000 [Oligoflexia bacterium]|nr:hypothetical protein [Oligoflexia bacterium]HMR25085.1 hypothetical protein [Oligoflexia bacterium]